MSALALEAPRVGADPPAPLCLFNSPQFHDVTLAGRGERLQIDHVAGGRPVGSLTGIVVGDVFSSGFSAPFGGVDLVRDDESFERIAELVAASCRRLGEAGIRTMRIRARPDCYSAAEAKFQFALLGEGFEIESVELNQHIPLAGLESVEAYRSGLSRRGQRAIRAGRTQGLAFAEATEPELRAEAYAVLRANRQAKGRPLRLSFEYLERLRAAMPGHIRTFVTLAAGRVCAAAVVYLVRPAAWLVVYWGDAAHELEHSPMNLLAHDLVDRALVEGIRVIDLGISSEGGVANAGLALFKEIVGARSALRLVLARTLES